VRTRRAEILRVIIPLPGFRMAPYRVTSNVEKNAYHPGGRLAGEAVPVAAAAPKNSLGEQITPRISRYDSLAHTVYAPRAPTPHRIGWFRLPIKRTRDGAVQFREKIEEIVPAKQVGALSLTNSLSLGRREHVICHCLLRWPCPPSECVAPLLIRHC